MLTALLIAANVVAYGPPTDVAVLEAYSAKSVANLREAGDALAEVRVRQFADFPASVRIERCRKKTEWRLLDGALQPTAINGYECIFEVWPNTEPSFRTNGFFRFDGFEWEFFGPERSQRVPSLTDFNRGQASGEYALKPGALAYDGDPENPLNENYDPYQSFFKSVPSGQNYRY